MTRDELIKVVAAILRDARGCEDPDGLPFEQPCPFCFWPIVDGDNSETGCFSYAEKIIEAIQGVEP